MPASPADRVVQQIRRLVLRDGGELTDGQLLESFVAQRDEVAIEALIHRHAPLVWGVCRRLLQNGQDAEDAFQATFLVLIRKASSIVPREMVANWLYGVAQQTASKARERACKRRAREQQVMAVPEPETAPENRDLWLDLQPVLDRELSGLPAKYRMPIVLCDLEGKPRKEAARQLGWLEGTLSGRLARARKLLADRLTRRGVALSVGALGVALSQQAAAASVPVQLLIATVETANLVAAGQPGAVPPGAAALCEEVMKSMFMTKCKMVAAAVVTLAVVSTGVGVLLPSAAAGLAQAPPAASVEVKAADSVADVNVAGKTAEKADDQKQTDPGPNVQNDDRQNRGQKVARGGGDKDDDDDDKDEDEGRPKRRKDRGDKRGKGKAVGQKKRIKQSQ
jgi:RNA polymerase sigma factor (sigma-70 family)